MMKFIQFNRDEMLNIESIECLYRHYLGGTVIIGKSGEHYTVNLPLEEVIELIKKLETED
jgi:uncharacterized protein YlzI (FlbEa/FlbD family)